MKLFTIHVTNMNNKITMNESISIKGYMCIHVQWYTKIIIIGVGRW